MTKVLWEWIPNVGSKAREGAPETPFVLHKINVTAENSTRKDQLKRTTTKTQLNHNLACERLKSFLKKGKKKKTMSHDIYIYDKSVMPSYALTAWTHWEYIAHTLNFNIPYPHFKKIKIMYPYACVYSSHTCVVTWQIGFVSGSWHTILHSQFHQWRWRTDVAFPGVQSAQN